MPILEKSEIRKKAKSGEVTILSLDTTVFSESHNDLETGIISHLSQFADSKVDLVLSDVVVAELEAHIKSSANSAHKLLKKSIKEIQKAKFINQKSHCDNIFDIINSEEPENIAKRRVSNFIKNTKAKIIKSDIFLSVNNLISSYFEFSPPFENNEKRKHEFPDAIALYSLEAYAQRQKKMILVVSKDKGWKRYCYKSEFLIYEDNLGIAMRYFQDLQNVIEAKIRKYREDFRLDIEREILRHIERMFIEPYVLNSKYTVGCDDWDINYHRFAYSLDPMFVLIYQNEKDQEYAFNVYVNVEVSVSATLDFYLTIGKTDYYVDSIDVNKEFSQSGNLTITVSGCIDSLPCIDSIFVNYLNEEFYFGDIRP